MSEGHDKGRPRDHVLWQANDLFGLASGVSCPQCGQPVRDERGQKRSQRLRHLIGRMFGETVPENFRPEQAIAECARFVGDLRQLADHSLGEKSGLFIETRMNRFLEKMQRDHQAGR